MALLYADKELNAVGEDTWELFEAIEESFGVDLGDYYALAGIGVGELASKICGLANYPVEASCLSGVTFYKLAIFAQRLEKVKLRPLMAFSQTEIYSTLAFSPILIPSSGVFVLKIRSMKTRMGEVGWYLAMRMFQQF